MTRQKWAARIVVYGIGLVVLALGISLNTKTVLGVSPIISVSYCLSVITGTNFGNDTFLLYVVFVLVEVLIHLWMRRFKDIVSDGLQIVLSLVFTRFLNVFSWLLPDFEADLAGTVWGTMPSRLFFLAVAIVCTGVGAAMSLNMRLVANPGDGIVQAISDLTKKDVGLVKNFVDISCVVLTCVVSLLFAGKIVGIGVGTLLAMLGVGRVIAVFNRLTMARLCEACGVA